MRQCTAYKPDASEMLMVAAAIPVLFIKDLLIPFKTIYPESQKMGSPTINPVIDKASEDLFSPTNFNIVLAIICVLPLFSSNTPIVVPSTIIKASFDITSPKPFFIIDRMSRKGIPTPRPVTKQAMINAKKGCTLNFTVSKTIDRMPAKRKIISCSKETFIKSNFQE